MVCFLVFSLPVSVCSHLCLLHIFRHSKDCLLLQKHTVEEWPSHFMRHGCFSFENVIFITLTFFYDSSLPCDHCADIHVHTQLCVVVLIHTQTQTSFTLHHVFFLLHSYLFFLFHGLYHDSHLSITSQLCPSYLMGVQL